MPVDPALREAVRTEAPRPRPAASDAPGRPGITPARSRSASAPARRRRTSPRPSAPGSEWVLRFAGPVLDERERVADEARRARARRSTTDGQTVVFGEAVDERFAAHGIDPSTIRWDARRREDGQWIISAHWVGGDAERVAEWTFQLSAPDRGTARRHRGRPAQRPADPSARRRSRPSRRSARRSRRRSRPASSRSLRWPTRTPGNCPASRRSSTRRSTPPTTTPSRRRRARLFDTALDDEPALPLDIEGRTRPSRAAAPKLIDLGIGARAESDEERAARAHVPSWDDILLGVRRKND